MRAAGRSTLVGRKRAAIRAAALVASAGCVVALAASGGAVASASTTVGASRSAAEPPAVLPSSWSSYLNGPLHSSYAPLQTSITPANASTLVQNWSQTVGAPYLSSPIVNRGSVYIGGANGYFYRLSEHTGQVLAKVYLGFQPATSCPYSLGVTSTANLAVDPRTHVLTVYVAGGDGYLYALRALTLTREWRSVIGIPSTKVNDYYDWSSPTIANGRIYVGIASSCDRPLVRGGVLAFSQTTGARLASFYTVPPRPSDHGGSVWSSIAVAPNGDVFATTGNGPYGRPFLADSESILKLNPDTLALLGRYQVPKADVTADGDFGGSPVIFGRYVGACNKNGIFYALQQSTMKLAWKQRIGHQSGPPKWGECIAAPVYNGKDLFFGGNATSVNGVLSSYGSVQERSPTTGALIWQTALPGGVMGSPTMDGAGVIAIGTYGSGTSGVYLVNSATGAILAPDPLLSNGAFSQSVFAENELFAATGIALYSYGLPSS